MSEQNLSSKVDQGKLDQLQEFLDSCRNEPGHDSLVRLADRFAQIQAEDPDKAKRIYQLVLELIELDEEVR
ncbi:MAG: hypothetical protein R6U55_11010 [Desulfovermiculus sp.]